MAILQAFWAQFGAQNGGIAMKRVYSIDRGAGDKTVEVHGNISDDGTTLTITEIVEFEPVTQIYEIRDGVLVATCAHFRRNRRRP